MSKEINEKTRSMTKVLALSVSGLMLMGGITAAANAKVGYNDGINSAEDLMSFQQRMARSSDKEKESLIAGDIKMKAMYDYAKAVAIRAAMTSRISDIQGVVEKHSRELDAIYNFEPLMIQKRVVPPVITEARDLYNQSSSLQIRLSKALYNIERQAYFSSTAPNWREYLRFNSEGSAYGKFGYFGGDMQPKTKMESEIWADATRKGWELGARQANVILEQAMGKLNRDYTGMVRFHTMVLEGKLTMPSVSNYNLYDSNNGSRLIIGEELLEIDVLPTFKSVTKYGAGGIPYSVNELNIVGDRVETPVALDRAPIKEVYDVVGRIRNEQDITNKPWKDSLPLARSSNPLERPVTINIEVKQSIRPVVNQPVIRDSGLTQEQVNNMVLVEEDMAPAEPPLRSYEGPYK